MTTVGGPRIVGRSLRAVKTGEMIAEYLRALIVRGELKEGDSLPSEVELMTQFEVSRPTLREAFRILETESLIAIKRGSRGARILAPNVGVAARYVGLLMQVSGTTLADVYRARTVLEPAAAGMLARRRTEADLADLDRHVDEIEAMLADGTPPDDVAAFLAASQCFHDLVLERAGNRTLEIQTAVLREVVALHLASVSRRITPETVGLRDYRRAVRSCRKLVELIRARDAEAAERHWRTHMEVAARALLPGELRSATVLDLFT
jgi:DNA-binding FadR family transcriptional regulator